MPKPFWQQKALSEMSADEWESLCDGCGKCCLIKLEDADNGDIYFTDVCCEQLNSEACRCSNYPQRAELVPDCLQLSPDTVAQINSLPSTCAYRLLAAGEPLPTWHPLVSGKADSVHRSGHSVRGKVISEQYVHPDELEDRIIQWVN